jgi:hypothetical protein
MRKLLLALAFALGFPALSYAAQADLTWSNPEGAKVRVERRNGLGAEPWVVVAASLPAGATSFSEIGLANDADYCYRPVAFNDFGDASQPWPEVCGSTRRPGNVGGVILIIRPDNP